MVEKEKRLIWLSDTLAIVRKLAGSEEFQEVNYGYKFLPKIISAMKEVKQADAVPMEFHECCLGMEVRKRIEAEKNAPHWRSVKDHPADAGTQYLVWLDDDCGCDIVKYAGNGRWMMPGGHDITRLVRYWMPLPKPPKEDEDDAKV